jgi:hypothetical protein
VEILKKMNDEFRAKEEMLKNQVSGALSIKEEDLSAYRKQLIEQEKRLRDQN